MVLKDKDLTGQRFGMLTVLEPAEIGKRGVKRWLCRCDCGNLTTTAAGPSGRSPDMD